MTQNSINGTIRVLEGTLLSVENSSKVDGVKVMKLDTQKGGEIVSIWGETPLELGGNMPKIGRRFRMEVLDKPRKSGEGFWTNLYKTRGGSWNIEEVGQVQLPKFEDKAQAQHTAEPAGKDKAAEFVEYQQLMAKQCLWDASAAIHEALGVEPAPEAVVTLAAAMFEKRTKAAYYFKEGAK